MSWFEVEPWPPPPEAVCDPPPEEATPPPCAVEPPPPPPAPPPPAPPAGAGADCAAEPFCWPALLPEEAEPDDDPPLEPETDDPLERDGAWTTAGTGSTIRGAPPPEPPERPEPPLFGM